MGHAQVHNHSPAVGLTQGPRPSMARYPYGSHVQCSCNPYGSHQRNCPLRAAMWSHGATGPGSPSSVMARGTPIPYGASNAAMAMAAASPGRVAAAAHHQGMTHVQHQYMYNPHAPGGYPPSSLGNAAPMALSSGRAVSVGPAVAAVASPMPAPQLSAMRIPSGGSSSAAAAAAAPQGRGPANGGTAPDVASAPSGAAGAVTPSGAVQRSGPSGDADTKCVRVQVPDGAPTLSTSRLLSTFTFPFTSFFSTVFAKRPLVMHGGGCARLHELVEDLHGCDLRTLMETSPSEAIHCWTTGADGTIDTYGCCACVVAVRFGLSLTYVVLLCRARCAGRGWTSTTCVCCCWCLRVSLFS